MTTTQQIFNTDDVYVSIYDRPKRGKGRPRTCTLTDEQKKERARAINRKYYRDNYEYCVFRQRLYDEQKKTNA